jgi:uncharacterized protein YjiS (DUF1127 family)
MLTSSVQITISLWQPLHLRLWHGLTGAAQAAWRSLLLAWQGDVMRARERREWLALAELNAATLKDIGAPDWVVRGAVEQREMAQHRLEDFSAWRGV